MGMHLAGHVPAACRPRCCAPRHMLPDEALGLQERRQQRILLVHQPRLAERHGAALEEGPARSAGPAAACRRCRRPAPLGAWLTAV